LTIKDVDLKLIEGRCLHVASFFLQGLRENTKKIIAHAHKRKMLVSFDTGWDPAGWSKGDKALVKGVLENVDIFFPNLREAEAITGVKGAKKACEELLDIGPRIVVLKDGKHGAYVATRKEFIFIPPYKVKSIDTTGAGDVFDAGFVFGRLRGWGLEKSGKFASAAAALKTRGFGSSAYPTKKEVLELL
jgi:2-dehydro-3-deoxygluconokinase